MNGRMAALEKDVKEVKASVAELKTQQETTDGVVTGLQDAITEVRKSVATKSSSVSLEVLSEMKDREDRKHNVVITGIKESAAVEKDLVYAEKNQLLEKLFREMQIDPAATSSNIKFKTRLGKKEPGKQPRPFLLKFHNVSVRDNVLSHAKKVAK